MQLPTRCPLPSGLANFRQVSETVSMASAASTTGSGTGKTVSCPATAASTGAGLSASPPASEACHARAARSIAATLRASGQFYLICSITASRILKAEQRLNMPAADKLNSTMMLQQATRLGSLSEHPGDHFPGPDRTTCSCRLLLQAHKTIRRRLFGRSWLTAAGLCGMHQVSGTPIFHMPTNLDVLENSKVIPEHCRLCLSPASADVSGAGISIVACVHGSV